MSALASVLLLKTVVDVDRLRLFCFFCLDFILDCPGENRSLLGPSSFFLSFYFSYNDMIISNSKFQVARPEGRKGLPKALSATLFFQAFLFATFGFSLS